MASQEKSVDCLYGQIQLWYPCGAGLCGYWELEVAGGGRVTVGIGRPWAWSPSAWGIPSEPGIQSYLFNGSLARGAYVVHLNDVPLEHA